MRQFESGATRDDDATKIDFEGFLSPLVLQRYGEYMQRHMTQADGEARTSDNWQAGIPKDAYMKSLLRHVMDVWCEHDGYASREGLQDALCAILFNAQGYLFETLRDESTGTVEVVEDDPECETCLYEDEPWEFCRGRGCKHVLGCDFTVSRWEPKDV